MGNFMPRAVKLGHRVYTVRKVNFDNTDGTRTVDGLIKCHEGEIHIAHDLTPDKVAEVFLHEVLHGILREVPHGFDRDTEESLVNFMAKALCAFMMDNPKAVDHIVNNLKNTQMYFEEKMDENISGS